MQTSRAQVEAYYYGNPTSLGTKILFVKREARLAEYKKCLNQVEEFGNVWHGLTGLLRGERVSVISTGIGPSMVGDAVYAINRLGAICLYSGTCGAIQDGLEIGDYFIADQAICGDGYSSLLGYSAFTAISGDRGLSVALKNLLDLRVERVHKGTTFTTGSVVREAEPDFWNRVGENCAVIEMGAAAFYAAAQTTGKRAIAYSWVTDFPTQGKSFFDPVDLKDAQIKDDRLRQEISLDLELLSAL